MESHVERFSGRVADYERYRTRYPEQVLEVLRERCGLRTDWRVADIGAGTGMVAELLLDAGCTVTAIEPNAEMRAACVRLLGSSTRLTVTDASAESTGLSAGSLEMVTVGRAFHWFDQPRAVAEFKRILRPGGWVVLLSNRRSEDGSALQREYEGILREGGNDYVSLHQEKRKDDWLRMYGDDAAFRVTLVGEQRLTIEEFLGQTQSYSVAPLPGQPKYAAMQAALREFFARWSKDGVLRMPTECSIAGWRTAAE